MQMKKLKYDYVVFDFDGTLFNSGEGIINTVKLALEFYNINVHQFQDMSFFVGPPLLESFQLYDGVDEEMATKLVAKYREYYRKSGLLETKMYDGVEELLLFLKSNGVKIGIGSSKPRHLITELLEHIGKLDLFDEISAVELGNSCEPKREIINRSLKNMGSDDFSRALMVGDRCYDIDGANQIGVDSIGVLYGYGSLEELTKHGATYIVNDCQEIVRVIQ